MGFSRSYRASIDRVQGVSFTVPDRQTQDRVIAQIVKLEEQIKAEEIKLEETSDKIAEILNQYLK